MIEFINVEKTFKTDFWKPRLKALDSLSFKIDEGEICGFLGANGAGKTTSLKIIMNFISKSSGEVIYSKKLGKSWRDIRKNIGYLPEHPFFYGHLTGREFCFYLGSLSGLRRVTIREEILKWGEKVNIAFALDRKIKKYSKGMMQRLGLLTSLIHNPIITILDEPLSGLDPIGRAEIKKILKELHREGQTIFFSSHIVSDLEEICSELIVIDKGRLVYQGGKDDLLNRFEKDQYTIELSDKSTIECHYDKKDEKIKEIISKGHSIIKIYNNRPSLEEVIYSRSK